MLSLDALRSPLFFRPIYQTVVWGGRRIAERRQDVPAGPIGEAWDISDHPRGPSVVADGPLQGRTLSDLVRSAPEALVGAGFLGDTFPLLVKLIDARDRLSVQVHPDDLLASAIGPGVRGKTECWYLLDHGGELFVGTVPGTTRAAFEAGLASGQIEGLLQRFDTGPGDCVHLPARTLHAIGRNCLLWEVQQTSDITYRVYDWGRLGLDGLPRPLHVTESLATIDFTAPPRVTVACHGARRRLVDCDYFTLDELPVGPILQTHTVTRATVVLTLDKPISVICPAGHRDVAPYSAVLVPAVAGKLDLQATRPGRALLATVVLRAP